MSKHKLNHSWQKAHDEVPGGDARGINRMFDAIADADQTPSSRFQAALSAFAANVLELAHMAVATGTSVDEAVEMSKQLLKHTVDNFDAIGHSVKFGHDK